MFQWHFFPPSQGQLCGLCGNYDGNGKNDFTTRSHETVADVLKFGNSWKASSSCPDATLLSDPCSSNRYRAAWSQKQCSIITSATFHSCHLKVTMFVANMHTYTHKSMLANKHNFFSSSFVATKCSLLCVSTITPPAQPVGVLLLQWYLCFYCMFKVDPGPYFDSCVRDSCACDSGGDCECFCTAVAAYAKACNEAGACIKWRTPKLCRKFAHQHTYLSILYKNQELNLYQIQIEIYLFC